ncbi:hypothetical protein FisN_31Lh064 [Fistulifera solaris]|uniref:Fe2OG dioxygenase domain-containing protein n=1 Tax=Fistulifera solaris TaxID=1519565 RepID=A0A1Z5K6F2_FISSO|nr:hypothetical protein FisN_31Lh064 [Fistulifera solaris]|eukprot:GAX21775.1 hypothetical protein FisN_31Lh064 [Fistulifera solaris]
MYKVLLLAFVAEALQPKSTTIGGIVPLVGQDGFLAAVSVPTFACSSLPLIQSSSPQFKDDMEPLLQQGPAFTLRSLLTRPVCETLIEEFETTLGFASFQAGKNHHGALQIVVPEDTCQILSNALRPFCREAHEMVGINRRWRVYRYASGTNQHFAPHIDSAFPPSGHNGRELVWDISAGTIVSRLTLLIYLNDDFVGGETNFYSQQGDIIASVRPEAGSCLVFPQAVGEEALDYARSHWPLHEGSPVRSGPRPKYVIRSDVMLSWDGISRD